MFGLRSLRTRTRTHGSLIPAVSPATCILVTGLAVSLFAMLPGPPHRLEQYDLPKDVALGVMGGVSALFLLRVRDSVREDSTTWTLAAFLAWGLVAALLNGDDHSAALRTVGPFAAAASVFLLARRVGEDGSSAEVYGGTVLVIGLICAFVLLEAYGGIPFLSAPGRRPGGTLGNRNVAARLACLALPLLWTRLIATDRSARRLMVLAVLSAMSAVITLSRSRGAFLVACVLVVFLPLVTWWRTPLNRRPRCHGVTAVWVAVLAFSATAAVVLPNRMGWSVLDFASSARRVAEYQSGTGRGRLIQAATTWRMTRQNTLWGVGPGNWSVVYPAYAHENDPSVVRVAFHPGPQIPRNDALTMVAEWGTVGAFLGMAFLAVLCRRIARLLLSEHEGVRMNGVLALGVSVTATMLGLFDSILRVAPTVVLLALLVGLALGAGEAEPGLRRPDTLRRSRHAWRALLCVFAALSLAFARGAAQDLRALHILNSFTTTRDLARAVQVAPNNVEARALLSYALVSAGRCDLAMSSITRAARLQPYSSYLTTLRDRCSLVPEGTRAALPR